MLAGVLSCALAGTLSHAVFYALTTHANRLKSHLSHTFTINIMAKNSMQEFYDCVDADLAGLFASVCRFYSNSQWLVISCIPSSKKYVVNTMCKKHGWTFANSGLCGGVMRLAFVYRPSLRGLPKCCSNDYQHY